MKVLYSLSHPATRDKHKWHPDNDFARVLLVTLMPGVRENPAVRRLLDAAFSVKKCVIKIPENVRDVNSPGGVVSVLCNTSKLNEKIGLSYTYITGGAWKAAGNGDTPLTDEERQYFQERITALHTLFKADVARHMKLTADPKAWGEAQILLAQPAKELGLITEIVRDLDSAVAKLAVEAQMTREELAASSPELLNALLAEGKTNAEAANRESIAKAADDAVAGTLAVVKAVVGEGVCVKIETILSTCKAARMDAAQIAAIVPILVTASLGPAGRAVARDSAEFGLPELASGNMCSELEAGKEAQARAAMLAGIQNAHQPPVAVTPGTEPTLSNPLLADAERRAKTVR